MERSRGGYRTHHPERLSPWYNMTALPSSYRAAGVFGDGRGDTMIWGDGIAVRCR
jgi:hypothetical protein